MLDLLTILKKAVSIKASDIFIISGLPVSFKNGHEFILADDSVVQPEMSEKIINKLYEYANRSPEKLYSTGDDDFSLSVYGLSRFRVCTYKQRGSLAAVMRVVNFEMPDYTKLHIPKAVIDCAVKNTFGLVVVTGPAGSGKSTTLACMIDEINSTRNGHIITLEDPIEFIHKNKKCIVSQREISSDTENYITALRSSLRQAPDVILVGEMRDLETIQTVITAAETGHLVISTLHTLGAANTIDRIIDVFPPNQQQQIRVQLSMTLQSVISEQLIPDINGEMIPAFEIMNLNNAIRNIIRDSKNHQIDMVIASSSSEGMISMDAALIELFKDKKITLETAVKYAMNPEALQKRISL